MPRPDPYSRSYWRFADEYPAIYDDDAAYALWSRLRDLADATWPSSPVLPITVKRPALRLLVDAGLVTVEGNRFRIRGMDKHRGQRRQSALIGNRARWGANASEDEDANALPSHPGEEEGRNANGVHIPSHPIRADSSNPSHDSALLDIYYQLTTKPPSRGAIDWLDRLAREHDEAAVIAAMGEEWVKSPAPKDFLSRVEMRLLSSHKRGKQADRIEAEMREREAERKRMEEAMSPEERRANLERLGAMLAQSGLVPKEGK